jgi:UDPglucose 6-dehydrogenase
VNEIQKLYLLDKIVAHFGEDLTNRHLAILGLAFKPRTDDMREAPAVVLINELVRRGATITATDPEAIKEAKRMQTKGQLPATVRFAKTAADAVVGTDALVLVTEWNEFRQPDFDDFKAKMKSPVVFDGRNIFNGKRLSQRGFTYYGVGVPNHNSPADEPAVRARQV